jgi:Negative regulator of sigma F
LHRQLDAWAAGQASAGSSPELARKVRDALKPSLTPVKPIPARRRLFLMFLAVFVAGSAGFIAFLSRAGLHLMTPVQIGGMSAMLAGGGILFAVKLAEQMIPGSRPGIPVWGLLTLGGVAAFVGLGTLFPWQTSGNFVSAGWPCAVMELTIVIPATAVFWALARRGALFASAGLGATLTGLAAFLVLIPLQFQCMFQQAPHLLVWHGGTALLIIGLGAFVGDLRRGRWSS